MRQPLTLEQTKSLLAKAALAPDLDAGLAEMLPADQVNYLQSAPDIISHLATLENVILQKDNYIAEINLALVEYANQSGQGQMMLDNLKLCLDQVRMQRAVASLPPGMKANLGQQGKG